MLRSFLVNEGYNGSFSEMIKDWEDAGFPKIEDAFVQPLFNDGTDGLWADPSDMSTMFQDSAGVTPVTTPGQAVGLMLDKSRGLVRGANAAAAGPTTVFAPWVSLGGGRYSIDGSQASYQSLYYEGILEVGATYEVTFTVESTTGAIRLASQLNSIDITGTGEKKAHLVAASSNFNIQAPPGVVATIEVGEVRKVPGNHLKQPTASKRPIYGVVPKGGRRNLLTWTEEFNQSPWLEVSTTVIRGELAPDGSLTAIKVSGGGASYLYADAVVGSGQVKSIYARTVSGSGDVALLDHNTVTGAVKTLTTEWQRFEVVSNTADTGGANFYAVDFRGGTLGEVLLWHPQLEEGAIATPYQRVVNQYDVTERGVETLHYLSFDGVDDQLESLTRFGMSANPSLYASFGMEAITYDSTVKRLFHIGDNSARTIAGSVGTEGMAWRHNDGNIIFGILTASENYVVSYLRAAGDTYGDQRAFVDGVEQIETSVGNALQTPASTVDATYIGSSVNGDYYVGKMFGAVLTASALDKSARGKTERYLARKSGVTL